MSPLPEAPDEVERLARLLRVAGSRIEPPRADYERVLSAASAALETRLAQRRRRMLAPIALAAGIAAIAVTSFWILTDQRTGAPAARAERLIGSVDIRVEDSPLWRPLRLDDTIASESSLRTGRDSRAGFRLAAGTILRIASDTEVAIENSHRVRLLRGTLYVDSGPIPGSVDTARDRSVEVAANLATARDVGTQFEVRVDGETYRLRVREGRVLLTHAGGESSGGAGEQLVVTADGPPSRSRIALDDDGWRWVETAAVAPDIENQPLSRVLAWVARETGRPIRYASVEIERRADASILHGSIRGLDPLDALETVLASSGLRYQIIDDGSILIAPA